MQVPAVWQQCGSFWIMQQCCTRHMRRCVYARLLLVLVLAQSHCTCSLQEAHARSLLQKPPAECPHQQEPTATAVPLQETSGRSQTRSAGEPAALRLDCCLMPLLLLQPPPPPKTPWTLMQASQQPALLPLCLALCWTACARLLLTPCGCCPSLVLLLGR